MGCIALVRVTLCFGWGSVVSGCRLKHCFSLHPDTTPPQQNHNVTPTHIEPEQYTHTQSQASEDECTSIRNMLSKKWSKWHQLVYLCSTIKMLHGPINIRFLTVFTASRHLITSCSRFTQSTPFHFISFKKKCNLILTSIPWFPKWYIFFLRFPTKTLNVLLFLYMSHFLRAYHRYWLDSPNIILWRAQIINLLVMQSLPLSCYLHPLRTKYLPQQLVLWRFRRVFVYCKRFN